MVNCRSKLQQFYRAVDRWTHTSVSSATKVRTGALAGVDRGQLDSMCAEANAAAECLSVALDGMTHLFGFSASGSGSSADTADTADTADMGSHRDHPDIAFAYSDVLVKVMQANAIRFIKFKKFSACVAHLQSITRQALKVCAIYQDLAKAHTRGVLDFEDLLQISTLLSADRLHLLSRSLYLGAIYSWLPVMGELVVQSMRRRGMPADLIGDTPPDAPTIPSRVRDEWVQLSVSRTAWDSLKALMVNRNRLLGKLEGLLSAWGNTTREAAFLDAQYQHQRLAAGTGPVDEEDVQQHCVAWVMLTSTQLMDLHMSLSVENELLGRDEMAYFYWYWDFICTTRAWAIDKLRKYRYLRENTAQGQYLLDKCRRQEAAAAAEKEAGAGAGAGAGAAVGKKSKSKSKSKGAGAAAGAVAGAGSDGSSDASTTGAPAPAPPLSEPPGLSEQVISIEEIVIRARGHVCRGIFRMFVAAHELNLLRRHDERYMSVGYKFQQRFLAFQGVPNPPPVTYEDFERTLRVSMGISAGWESDPSLDVDCAPLIEGASICFSNARKYVDEIKKLMPGAPPEDDQVRG
jgi:hypothetical protein